MSDLRKAEIAHPKLLFASVKRNIVPFCRPLGVSRKRQIGSVSCGIEAHFPPKHELRFLEHYAYKLGTNSGTPYATSRLYKLLNHNRKCYDFGNCHFPVNVICAAICKSL